MPRFFVDASLLSLPVGSTVVLEGESAHHIAYSLRMRQGEEVTLCDGNAREAVCTLLSFTDKTVSARIESKNVSKTEPPVRLTLCQGLPKADKLDEIIQKSVECGVSEILPFESRNCVVKITENDRKKQERRQKIALEAAKQCGRGVIPSVCPSVPFSAMLDRVFGAEAHGAPVLFCYEGDGVTPIRDVAGSPLWQNAERAYLIIGSEGGFTSEEAEEIVRRGGIPIGLGPRILRTETASVFALGALLTVREE